PSLDYPIELGAEFIHGAPDVTFNRLGIAGLTFFDVIDSHLHRKDGKLQEIDYFEKMETLFEKLDKDRKPDRTVEEFLDSQKVSGAFREMVNSYVEGFHAADPRIMGERGMATAENAEEDLNGSYAFRVTQGYDRLMASFLNGVDVPESPIRLNTIVRAVEWKKGEATLKLQSAAGFPLASLKAKKVVITVPIGVLKAPEAAPSSIKIEPRPEGFDTAIEALHMGHTLRIVLRFRSRRLWESIQTEDPIAYLHAPAGSDFPTWWTMYPMRTPLLVGWQGGPQAEKLSRLTEEERVRAAVATLAKILDQPEEVLHQELESWYMHDWTKDPFSYGAYSFVGVNGDEKSERLTKPFSDTLYFAGEATHVEAERGTVDGAIETGVRAADQVLATL
ncbi:MAG: FAD-dependent oxidoreductase, partial [Proteobacteria bacterium]